MKIGTAFRMGFSALNANVFGRSKPVNVMLGVTNRCNQRCRYCQIPDRHQPEMSTEQILGLLDEMKAAGTERLGLWGGEPLLHPDIERIVTRSKELGFWISMDTNGVLVPKKLDVIRKLDHLMVSIDGPEEVNDLNRQPGAFKHAMTALQAAHGLTSLWTLSVLTRHNLNSIDYLFDLARRFDGMAAFQFLHHNQAMAGNTDDMRASDEEYRNAVRYLIHAKRRGEPVASSFRYLRYLLNWPDYSMVKQNRSRGQMNCWAGRLYCNVDADGSVLPCSLLIDERPALNAVETGFRTAFDFAGKHVDCKSCDAACFTEYNFLYDLDPGVIWDWLNAMRRTKDPHE